MFAFLLLLVPLFAQESAPAQPRRTVTGRIELPADSPKDPVRVWLWEHDEQSSSCKLLGEVMADGGRFAFRDVPWRAAHEWFFGFFLLVARQRDHAIGLLSLRGDAADPGKADLVLRKPVTLRGTVLDEDGKPVAGASVHPFVFGKLPGNYDGFAAPQPPWQTRTDEQGRYALGCLIPETPVNLLVRHPSFALQRAEFTDVTAAGDVTLHRGAIITGQVRHADATRAVRVRVEAQGIRQSAWAQVLTDDEGRYRLESLEPDSYNVWARVEGLTCEAVAGLAVEAGETASQKDIVLVTGGFIEGRVVDATTGKPVRPGATADVGLYGPSRPRPGAAIECVPVAADGTFRIRAAPGSNYAYLRAGEGWGGNMQAVDVVVEEGKTVKVEFKVRPPGTVK